MSKPRKVAVLGATGSVGRQALDVVRESGGWLKVHALACRGDVEGMARLVGEFRPAAVAMTDPVAAEALVRRLKESSVDRRPKILAGEPGLLEIAGGGHCDLILNAVVGSAGLMPTLAALESGAILALANKESLVMAGPIVMDKVASGGTLVPVDSEHSSLFRCLSGRAASTVRSLTLTGSGGALKNWTAERMQNAGPDEVLRHPVWNMGRRVTVDSATLMNKGLEIIEAQHLFQADLSKINVVIHPQAIVHGLVELEDGTLLAHLSEPDMKLPIAYAMYYPSYVPDLGRALDLAQVGSLTFEKPDLERFPCLCLGYKAAKEGGTLPAVMNAADEVAVEWFLSGKLRLTQIGDIVRQVMDEHRIEALCSVEQVMEADRWARERARSLAAP